MRIKDILNKEGLTEECLLEGIADYYDKKINNESDLKTFELNACDFLSDFSKGKYYDLFKDDLNELNQYIESNVDEIITLLERKPLDIKIKKIVNDGLVRKLSELDSEDPQALFDLVYGSKELFESYRNSIYSYPGLTFEQVLENKNILPPDNFDDFEENFFNKYKGAVIEQFFEEDEEIKEKYHIRVGSGENYDFERYYKEVFESHHYEIVDEKYKEYCEDLTIDDFPEKTLTSLLEVDITELIRDFRKYHEIGYDEALEEYIFDLQSNIKDDLVGEIFEACIDDMQAYTEEEINEKYEKNNLYSLKDKLEQVKKALGEKNVSTKPKNTI